LNTIILYQVLTCVADQTTAPVNFCPAEYVKLHHRQKAPPHFFDQQPLYDTIC
jgi:hypothetical protein